MIDNSTYIVGIYCPAVIGRLYTFHGVGLLSYLSLRRAKASQLDKTKNRFPTPFLYPNVKPVLPGNRRTQPLTPMAYLKNLEKVSVLKQQIQQKSCSVPKSPGVYRWWFTEEDTQLLMKSFGNNLCWNRIDQRKIDGATYYALYVGISKDLLGRIKWHATQKHSASAVKSGYLSTLRQSVSALLGKDQSKSEKCVSALLERCYWEWDVMQNPEVWEKQELQQPDYYYPINLQHNQSFPKQLQDVLSKLRKCYKK